MSIITNLSLIASWSQSPLVITLSPEQLRVLFGAKSADDKSINIQKAVDVHKSCSNLSDWYVGHVNLLNSTYKLLNGIDLGEFKNVNTDKIEQLASIVDQFKKAGYPTYRHHEWFSEMIDDKGHVKEVVSQTIKALNVLFEQAYNEMREQLVKDEQAKVTSLDIAEQMLKALKTN